LDVENPTIGFSGFKLSFPDGYQYYEPIKERWNKTKGYGQTAWRMATDFDGLAFNHTHEIIVFQKKGHGVALAVTHSDIWGHFSKYGDEKMKSEMEKQAEGFKFPRGDELYRKVEKINGHWVAQVGREILQGKNKFVNIVYIVSGTKTETFSLNGVAYYKNQESLENDMESIVESLVF